MKNFDLLLQKIQQNELVKLAIDETDKLNNKKIITLAEALTKNTSIKTITITTEAYFKDVAGNALFKVILKKIKNNELEKLSFMLPLTTNEIILLGEALKNNSSLISLMLADGIINKSMPLITESLTYHKTLLHLNLDSNFATDESVSYLCDMISKNCSLQSLSLQNNNFSLESIKLIAKTAKYFNQSLINLNLNNNPGSNVLTTECFHLEFSLKFSFFNREIEMFPQKKSDSNESFDNTDKQQTPFSLLVK